MKKDFITGLKFVCALLIYLLPFYCIIGACGFGFGFGSMTIFAPSFVKISLMLLIMAVLCTIVLYSLILPASILVFVKTNSLWSFYKFEEIFNIIKSHKTKYIKAVIIMFVCGFIIDLLITYTGILCIKYDIKLLWLFIIPSIMSAYFFYVLNYLVTDIEV